MKAKDRNEKLNELNEIPVVLNLVACNFNVMDAVEDKILELISDATYEEL